MMLMILGVQSDLSRDHDEETAEALRKTAAYWKTPDEGASTTLVAALDPALDGKVYASGIGSENANKCLDSTGLYMADCQFVDCAKFASDPDIAERLWHLSEELVTGKHPLPA